MKAIIVWGSYGSQVVLADVRKLEREEALKKGYKEPEKIYDIVKEFFNCSRSLVDIKKICGNEFNYLSSNIGYTTYTESYVCPINEQQYNLFMKELEKIKEDKYNDEKDYKIWSRKIVQEESELLIKKNEFFKARVFNIYVKGILEKITIISYINIHNSFNVRLNSADYRATLKYKRDKVFIELLDKEVDIDITKNRNLIDFLWGMFGHNGSEQLYRFTTEYLNNYTE